ncbi:hypothetical protein [Leptolyngbya sp. FACHB-711]|uniref:hypothetical protein n=1 Tax=Leptolyngbya sp. FACHB-711 TaxID=2692813 RepID=UPI0016872496|nr:hypothetical protein [Leptolyngbya sp. FACHB-711]MBD1852168.1 hypothetical protein [Cyanobacteria bacterium FACHB-502]MBD2028244.1 hypothetical protein [Leptolyngbya sp. FACHB-711]
MAADGRKPLEELLRLSAAATFCRYVADSDDKRILVTVSASFLLKLLLIANIAIAFLVLQAVLSEALVFILAHPIGRTVPTGLSSY